jgi:AraC-like DNA-binding protein
MPRSSILGRFPEVERLVNAPITQSASMGDLLGHIMKEALLFPHGAPELAKKRIGTAFLDTLTAVLELNSPRFAEPRSETHVTLHGKALRFIKDNLDDDSLSVGTIARALNVSERTLARAFATAGSTPTQELWRARVQRSFELLKGGTVSKVTQAAYQCGFSDLSHFCRLFKKTYNMTPRTALTRDETLRQSDLGAKGPLKRPS